MPKMAALRMRHIFSGESAYHRIGMPTAETATPTALAFTVERLCDARTT
jgi:hypothetical protein